MIFVYVFIIGLPGFFIFYIIKKMMKARSVQQNGVTTDAFITNVHTHRFHKGSMDILTLEYTDAAGRRYPAKATVTVGKYRAGQSIPVSYLPRDPGNYSFDKGQGYWGVLIFFILLFLFTIFASYKIDELVKAGNYQFTGWVIMNSSGTC